MRKFVGMVNGSVPMWQGVFATHLGFRHAQQLRTLPADLAPTSLHSMAMGWEGETFVVAYTEEG